MRSFHGLLKYHVFMRAYCLVDWLTELTKSLFLVGIIISDVEPFSILFLPELLSQLSGVRRSAGGQLNSGPSASQLQQLQMQLQLERQQAQAARQQLETARNATRGGGRANAILNTNSAAANPNANHNTNSSPNPGPPESNTQHTAHSSQFLLSRWVCCSYFLRLPETSLKSFGCSLCRVFLCLKGDL